jgi:hypothetical protein
MTTEDQNRNRTPLSNTQRAAQAAVLGTLVAVSAAAPAAEPTVSVVETVQLGANANRTWSAIRDFSAWPTWHPAFADTQMVKGDGHSKGAVRVLVTKDGAKFTEELTAFDPAARSYQYRIIESPAPVVDYVSTVQVKETAGGSTVVWSSRFNVAAGTSEADAKSLISGVYRAGLDNLASTLK